MATRRTYKCPADDTVFEVTQELSQEPHAHCPTCLRVAQRYYGGQGAQVVPLNLGWRGMHGYATAEDARIAQYQFEHL